MKIDSFKEVYDENRKLDKAFLDLYGNGPDIVLKNKIELLVELGELCNESRCFKYWSNKEVDRKLLLFEYADVIIMTLYFFDQYNISLDEEFPTQNDLDAINEFIFLYGEMAKFGKEDTRDLIKNIFVNVIRLGNLLGLSETEVLDSCLEKIKITFGRLNVYH